MQDGAWWYVDDVLAAVQAERPGAAKGSVNSALARAAEEGGPLERHDHRRGTYRVKPDVLAGWERREAEVGTAALEVKADADGEGKEPKAA
jgi:hypothetical protein